MWELMFYNLVQMNDKGRAVCEINEEARLIEMIHSSTDTGKAVEVAVKVILDFLGSSQSLEA